MNFSTMKMLLSEVGPKRITKDYNYDAVCDNIEQINILLRKPVFKVVEEDGIKLYRADGNYMYNKYYSHLTSDAKMLSNIKTEYVKKIKRYTDYLSEYYTSVYGEPFNEDGKPTTWYRIYR